MDLIRILEIGQLGEFLRGHVTRVSYAMATSLVVVVSGPVNAFLSRMAARWNFLVRTLFYVLLFAAGYPAFAFWSERILRQFLSDQKPVPLAALTAIAFTGFGVWVGQRKPFK